MPARKILILGLDALPWSILRPVMARGYTPFLEKLAREGCAGTLRSTVPHQTPSAWTTFMTGVHPGTHGVLHWQRYDASKNEVGMNNVERVSGKCVYRRFANAGLKTGVVMQPVTYPPFDLPGGFMLTGFDSPGINSPFAMPRELEKEVLQICPNHAGHFEAGEEWEIENYDTDDAVFAKNIGWLGARCNSIADLSIALFKSHPVDVLMVYFQYPDLLLHRAWKWTEPDGAGAKESPARHAIIAQFFRELDRSCMRVWENFRAAALAETGEEPLVLAASDHGQHQDKMRVRMNTILAELGWLVPARGVSLIKDGVRRVADKIGKRKPVGFGVPIDWAATKAFMPLQSCTGFVYLNLKGRQPHGCVDPKDLQRERKRLVEDLRAYRDPVSGQSYFDEVGEMRPEDGWDPALTPPDVFVQPGSGVEFVRRYKKGERFYTTKRTYAGVHHPDGMYILNGPGVDNKPGLNAHIADITPTLLASAGLPVPSYIQGKVMADCFSPAPDIQTVTEKWDTVQADEAYSASEAAVVEKRLADLGYLD